MKRPQNIPFHISKEELNEIYKGEQTLSLQEIKTIYGITKEDFDLEIQGPEDLIEADRQMNDVTSEELYGDE